MINSPNQLEKSDSGLFTSPSDQLLMLAPTMTSLSEQKVIEKDKKLKKRRGSIDLIGIEEKTNVLLSNSQYMSSSLE